MSENQEGLGVCPGRSAARSGALQTRDRYAHRLWNGPASAVHRHSASKTRVNALMALHRVRDTSCYSEGTRHQRRSNTMTPASTPASPPAADEPTASRRDFVAAAASIAAAAGTASAAQAQASPNVRFQNPPGMSKPPTYSHVVEVSGPHRTVYLA